MEPDTQSSPFGQQPVQRPGPGLPGGTLVTVRRVILAVSLPFGILSFVLPIYGQDIGATAVQIGLFFSAFSFMTVLLRPLVGAGLDRYGRRPFFVLGVAGYGLAMLAFAVSSQVWSIVVARSLQGIAASLLWLAADAITADVAPEDERGQAFGRMAQANMRGGLLGTLAGLFVLMSLGFDRGWAWLFAGYGIVSLVAAAMSWRRLPETWPRSSSRSAVPIAWSRPLVLLLLVTLVTAASWSMVSPIVMIYLGDRLGAGVQDLALAYLPATLVWAFLPSRLGRLADRTGRKPLMVLGLAVAAASSFLLPSLTSLAALAALWGLQAVCHAAGDPAEQALVADLTGGDQRGRAYGLYAAAAGLGATLGPLLGGWLYDAAGVRAPFYANGIVLAACTLVLWLWLRIPGKPLRSSDEPAGEPPSARRP